ncbi:Cytochrome c oxidase polypeptide V [Hyphodiscus hymeniophilus]|uniref:Cytochrome c oxidase polypeptide V n=1 Tax=Hyphodiscus hymeniophilus TaxID=353542 RepID=A0A9P6VI13_9HELO|nr:Cytochrome c oxidase polypeptide V [Hyphodiscus hymeniophilus]
MLRQQVLRSSRPIVRCVQVRKAHAISNPTLANIEKRWEGMPPQEQADLWMALRDRMKANWAELTVQEKKAGEGWKVAAYTGIGITVSFLLFVGIRSFARPGPDTMNKEYQEATNEYLKSQNSEPISGISSEGYVGKGQVQSPAKSPK